MRRKLLTLIFVVAIVCVASVVASAATFTVGDVTIDQGTETVQVPISISDNANTVATITLNVVCPDGITMTKKATQGEALADCTFSSYANSTKITWVYDDVGLSDEGVIAYVTLNVPADIAAGDYVVSLEVVTLATTNEDYEEVELIDTASVVPGTITVKGSEPAATLTAIGKNLVLDGGINAKVKFEYTGTETLYINGNAVEKAADGYYYAEIAKSAKDYADEVTFTATASDVDEVVVETSVAAIIDEYQETAEGTLLDLVNAAETYCSYAVIYFAGSTVPTVNATVEVAAPSIAGAQDGITFNSTSLVLRDKVALRHYFNVATGTDVAALGLTELDATHAYVEYANIAVADLADVITTEIGGLTINFAPLAYASINEDANVANLVNALYNYYVAAVAYAG